MRPRVDVVVPFRGTASALRLLVDRMAQLRLADGDSVTVVDNNPGGGARDGLAPSGVRVVGAPARQSSYHARNRGAAVGHADWLLFLDADVEAPPDLIDRYFEQSPAERTAVLAGAVADDAPVGRHETLAGRYARLRRLIDQQNTLTMRRPYAKTANCAVRRATFEEVDGFTDEIRSGGDADLCFRLAGAGWTLEERAAAVVAHRSRRALLDLLGQRARHGSGAEWLEQRYPGFVGRRRRWRGIAKDLVVGWVRALGALMRSDVDQAVIRFIDPLSEAAFEVGRRVPNLPWREQTRIGPIGRLLSRRVRAVPRKAP